MELTIRYNIQDARRLLLWLVGTELGFVIMYIVTNILFYDLRLGPIRKFFDLDRELSIPAWFSSIQLFIVGLILLVASRKNKREQHLPSAILVVLSLGFVFLSADEAIGIHEKVTMAARELDLDWLMFTGNHGAWIAVYFIVALPIIIIGARYFRRAWRYFSRETSIALFGMIIFATGAVGFEIIGYLFLKLESTSNLYKVEVIFEEFFEMSGISIILYAALLLLGAISSKASQAGETICTPCSQELHEC